MPETKLPQAKSSKMETFLEAINDSEQMLLGTAYRATRHWETAEDIVQETYIKAMRGLDGFKGDSEFKTWLYAIMKNKILDWRRALQARPEEPCDDEVLIAILDKGEGLKNSPEEQLLAHEEYQQTLESINMLTEKERETVIWRIQGHSHEEIARYIGLTISASKSRIHRAGASISKRRAGAED